MTAQRVLITGANGQLGTELCRTSWPESTTLLPKTSADLDITDDAAVRRVLAADRPDVIVNAAAFTNVDAAESDEAQATLVNGIAVESLASAANSCEAALIHISTDYVFDGSKAGWYDEGDAIKPLNAYGRSKARGEEAARAADRSVVLRTAWVYSEIGRNFLTTMIRLARERDEIGVVADQFGCPTAAADVADVVVAAAAALLDDGDQLSAILHVCAPNEASWFDFARAILDSPAVQFEGEIKRLTTLEYPTPAARPMNSRLSSAGLARELGIVLPEWEQSLSRVLRALESGRG